MDASDDLFYLESVLLNLIPFLCLRVFGSLIVSMVMKQAGNGV